MHWRFAGLVVLGLTMSGASAAEQDYPTKPVKIIVDRPAGAPHDLLARAVAERLSVKLKQSIIVENIAGAGGNIAMEYVARAAPDGYTLLCALDTTLTVNPVIYKSLKINPDTALKPLAIFGQSNIILAADPAVPIRSLEDFVSYAKMNSISYGHGGNGSPSNVTMEYFRRLAGFSATPIPYRGNVQVLSDLLSGQIKFAFLPVNGIINYVEEGRLRGIAVSAITRVDSVPNVPTIAESGYPNFNVKPHYFLLAPAKVPNPVLETLQRELALVLAANDLKERFKPFDVEVVSILGADAEARLKSEKEIWRNLLKKTEISTQQ